MNTKKWIMGIALCTGVFLASCTSDEGLSNPAETGQGQLTLSLVSGTSFKEETRALDETSFSNTDNYNVVVTDKDGYVKMDCKGSEIVSKMPITLPVGSCTVKAYYGTDSPASRNSFYVLGEWNGNIKGDQKESITLTCEPTCGRVKVDFADDMATYYSDYNVTFSGTKALGNGTFAWNKNDKDPWYVALDKGGEYINFTINSTTKDEYVNSANQEQTYAYTGKFFLERNKAYKMCVNVEYHPSQGGSTSGEVGLTITIDVSTNDKNETIEVPVTWI